MAIQNNETVGYTLACGNRILQCYADLPHVAAFLLRVLLNEIGDRNVQFFIVSRDDWLFSLMIDHALHTERFERRHSRCLNDQVNWSAIFILNMGYNLF
ncbi:hypothetical protein AB6A40_001388 [Gnathostoma spinigerum]|uniref:Uncharacterized protein n=1 Tax=Gnathostoma spinigerum TaxID=75299 RepID=A0ABD6E956_9BILA